MAVSVRLGRVTLEARCFGHAKAIRESDSAVLLLPSGVSTHNYAVATEVEECVIISFRGTTAV